MPPQASNLSCRVNAGIERNLASVPAAPAPKAVETKKRVESSTLDIGLGISAADQTMTANLDDRLCICTRERVKTEPSTENTAIQPQVAPVPKFPGNQFVFIPSPNLVFYDLATTYVFRRD